MSCVLYGYAGLMNIQLHTDNHQCLEEQRDDFNKNVGINRRGCHIQLRKWDRGPKMAQKKFTAKRSAVPFQSGGLRDLIESRINFWLRSFQ
eukprot:4490142-Amphidinium_carterae.1